MEVKTSQQRHGLVSRYTSGGTSQWVWYIAETSLVLPLTPEASDRVLEKSSERHVSDWILEERNGGL